MKLLKLFKSVLIIFLVLFLEINTITKTFTSNNLIRKKFQKTHSNKVSRKSSIRAHKKTTFLRKQDSPQQTTPIKQNCMRVYSKINFQSDFKDYCSNDELKNIPLKYSDEWSEEGKISFELGPNTILIVNSALGISFWGSGEACPLFPPVAMKDPKLEFLSSDEALIFKENNFTYDRLKLKKGTTTKVSDLWFTQDIKSFIAGHNTLILLIKPPLLGGKDKITELVGSSTECLYKDFETIEVINLLDSEIPEIDNNCALFFNQANFGFEEKELPTTVCKSAVDTKIGDNDENGIKDLKDVRSALVGPNTTLVVFNKPNWGGSAIPINDKAFDFTNAPINLNIKSMTFIPTGCYMVFRNSKYNGKKNKFCVSIDNITEAFKMYLDKKSGVSSIILGPNTVVEIFSEEMYKGNMLRLKSNVDVANKIFTGFNTKSIRIVDTNREVKMSGKTRETYELNSCIIIYTDKNYTGGSMLFCESFPQDEDDPIKFRSIVVPPKIDLILIYKSVGSIYDTVEAVHIDQSTPDFPNESGSLNLIKFEVLKSGCILLFSECDFKGKMFKLCNSSRNLSEELDNNLTEYNSILVGEDTKVSLYDVIEFGKQITQPVTSISESLKCIKNSSNNKVKGLVDNLNSIQFINNGENNEKSTVFYSSNSLLNFYIGAYSGFTGIKSEQKALDKRDKVQACIKKLFSEKPEKAESKEVFPVVEEYSDSNEGFFSGFISSGKSFLTKFLNWFCNFRSMLIKAIVTLGKTLGLVENVDLSKDGFEKLVNNEVQRNKNIVLSEKDKLEKEVNDIKAKIPVRRLKRKNSTPTRRKFRVSSQARSKGFLDEIKNIFSKIKEYVVAFVEKTVLKIFENIKDKIKKLIDKVKNFFLGPIIEDIKFFLKCGSEVKKKAQRHLNNLESSINLLLDGFKLAPTGLGIILLLDFFLAQLCQYKQFQLSISYFTAARYWEAANPNTKEAKWTLYGIGIGSIFKAIAEATPLSKILKTSLKLKDSIF